ncbi:MAG: hypothetical protein JWN25_3135 [Verrucomicrobiales bacterium]|nr:hypothetical protein [Verrucomicrobiales bacterium]
MGLLELFGRQDIKGLTRLPTGSFTVDASGRILSSTLPQIFPRNFVEDIAAAVLASFKEGQKAGLPLSDLVINYASLKITARELRGGAIIFLAPLSIKRT